jgi:hypothetical protein
MDMGIVITLLTIGMMKLMVGAIIWSVSGRILSALVTSPVPAKDGTR